MVDHEHFDKRYATKMSHEILNRPEQKQWTIATTQCVVLGLLQWCSSCSIKVCYAIQLMILTDEMAGHSLNHIMWLGFWKFENVTQYFFL